MLVFFSYTKLSEIIHEKQHECACCSTTINLRNIQTEKKVSPKEMNTKTIKPKKIEKKYVEKIEKKIPIVKKPIEERVEAKEEQPLAQVTQEVVPESNNTKAELHCKTDVVVFVPTPKQTEDDYLSQHISQIVAMLKENLYYPRSARKKGIEGVVKVKFTLSTDAKISNIQIIQSKYEILSRAAIETIESLGGKMPKPKEELTLTIPINYDLK